MFAQTARPISKTHQLSHPRGKFFTARTINSAKGGTYTEIAVGDVVRAQQLARLP